MNSPKSNMVMAPFTGGREHRITFTLHVLYETKSKFVNYGAPVIVLTYSLLYYSGIHIPYLLSATRQ